MVGIATRVMGDGVANRDLRSEGGARDDVRVVRGEEGDIGCQDGRGG